MEKGEEREWVVRVGERRREEGGERGGEGVGGKSRTEEERGRRRNGKERE